MKRSSQQETGKRVVFFFDGFNFYHSLKHRYRKYLFLNYRRLAELFVPKKDHLEAVVYFTAYATWKKDSERRHREYVRLLRVQDVEVTFGKFKTRDRHCKLCGKTYQGHEEKQTDVNIAVNVLTWAFEDRFDELVLCTADSDIIPALRVLKKDFPHKRLTLLFPIGRSSYELGHYADKMMYVKEKHLKAAQFPSQVHLPNGSVISRPSKWR